MLRVQNRISKGQNGNDRCHDEIALTMLYAKQLRERKRDRGCGARYGKQKDDASKERRVTDGPLRHFPFLHKIDCEGFTILKDRLIIVLSSRFYSFP